MLTRLEKYMNAYKKRFRITVLFLTICLCPFNSLQSLPTDSKIISSEEFLEIIDNFSEDPGFYHSDNFVSNEESYLQVYRQLTTMGIRGGAYIGVGPEQNFTYIAAIRPDIAFIVDIRRDALLQHLLYKALFSYSATRYEFLSNLFCRQLPMLGSSQTHNISTLLDNYSNVPVVDDGQFEKCFKKAMNSIENQTRFPLDNNDRFRLKYIYRAFMFAGSDISYDFDFRHRPFRPGHQIRLKRLILQTDRNGRHKNFLLSDKDYNYVKLLHQENRIIPITGNFAGDRTFKQISQYLKLKKLRVSAFYVSNVEYFLMKKKGSYTQFVKNVNLLPVDSNSVFIRFLGIIGKNHKAHVGNDREATVLQKISRFKSRQKTAPYKSLEELGREFLLKNR